MQEYEYNYHVIMRNVVKEKGGKGDAPQYIEVTGELNYTFSEYDNDFPIPTEKKHLLKFNPLVILGDLRNREQAYEYLTERHNIDKSWQDLSNSYEYEYGFGKPLYIGNDEQYLKFISKLDKIMRNNECTTLRDLEKIQKRNNLNLDCTISVEEENILFELLQKKQRNVTKKTYKPLEYKFGKTNNALNPNSYMRKNHQFYYHCHTMADVIFSILHFIVLHKYEFKTCALCQKRYAKIPNHGQGKYCPRKSPLGINSYFEDDTTNKKFEDLDCQASMRKFYEIMRNKKKSKLRCAPNYNQENSFINAFNDQSDKVKETPTVNNLIYFYSFVNQYKFNL